MSTLYTITETRNDGTETTTIKGSTAVLVLTDGSRRTSDGIVPVYLLDKRATMETTLDAIMGGTSGIADDETDGHDIAVPFVVMR